MVKSGRDARAPRRRSAFGDVDTNQIAGAIERLGSTILVGATHESRRYVVSTLGGGSEWVMNVRAAGGAAFEKIAADYPVFRIDEMG